MTKKIIAFTLALICAASLTACKTESADNADTASGASSETTIASTDGTDKEKEENAVVTENNAAIDVSDADINEKTADAQDIITKAAASTVAYVAETEADEAPSEVGSDKITFNGSSISGSASGVSISGSTVKITSAGTFTFTGTLSDGQIVVDAADKGNVNIVLDGVDITSSNSAAIYVIGADKVVVTLADGTTNTLTDGSTRFDQEITGALYSKDDLVITGNGSLNVNANYNDGIVCKDTLKIASGKISVTSVDDGIIGKDFVSVTGGDITVNAGGDGIKSTNDADATLGYLAVSGGTFNITAVNDAVQASTDILVTGGSFNISTGGGSASAPQKSEWGQQSQQSQTDSSSAKGFKAGGNIIVKDGTITLDTCDDSFNSKNYAEISGGTIAISAGDDAIHADTALTVYGGDINVKNCYEGYESAIIAISGGNSTIISSDDGINVSGGSDTETTQGGFGQDSFSETSSDCLLITGGTLKVNAGGDGLDSNTSIYMTGGEAYVDGPTNDGNGALDYNGDYLISSGTLVAVGSSGMALSPTASSKQSFIATNEVSGSAGDTVSVKDSSGKEIISYTAAKQFSSVVVSTSEIVSGETYTVSCGTSTATATAGTALEGGFGGGNGGMGDFGGGGTGNPPSGDFNGNPPSGNFDSGDRGQRPSGDFGGGRPNDNSDNSNSQNNSNNDSSNNVQA